MRKAPLQQDQLPGKTDDATTRMKTPFQKLVEAREALDKHDREAPILQGLPGDQRKAAFEKQEAERRPFIKAVRKALTEFEKTRPENPDDWMSRHADDLQREEASE